MVIEPVNAIGPVLESSNILAPAKTESVPSGFGQWFSSEISGVNDRLVSVDRDIQNLALGGTQNLHQVMINMEEARHSFQLLVQVRNRLLEAYQEVMRMQV